MNVAQLEHAGTFTESLPALTTLERMENLFISWRREIITAKNRRFQLEVLDDAQMSDRYIRISNQLTQSELRQKEIRDEIINVARLIVAEADNSEALLAALRLREQLDSERAALEVGK